MTTIDQINRTERQLHAAKGRLRELKQSRWIDQNYKSRTVDQSPIIQAEQEIELHRKTLAKLYQAI